MLHFNHWFAPVLAKPVCYIGSAACLVWGLYLIAANSPRAVREHDGPTYMTTYYPADWHLVSLGWLWVIIGPLFLRLTCETIAAVFRLRELAESDKAKTVAA